MNTSYETATIYLTSAYLVERNGDRWTLTLNSEAIELPMLIDDDGSWLQDAPVADLEVRCHAIRQANSVFIAWLIRMVQAAPQVKIRLTGVSDRVRLMLRRLKMESLVAMV